MLWVILIAVVTGLIIAGIFSWSWGDWPAALACGALIGMLVFFLGGIVYLGIEDDSVRQRKEELCRQQGGVVSSELCFRDNRPIEFEPGVWK